MFNKTRCKKCKWHGYLSNSTAKLPDSSRDRVVMCDYAKYHDHTCLHAVGINVEDRRGDDPDNCLLYIEGERPKRPNRMVITHQEHLDRYYYN